jgi:hypothetical protein
MRTLHDTPRIARVAASFATLFATLYASSVAAEAPRPRWSVGTSAWMLANLLPDPPEFYYLEVSRAVGERDALVIEPVTWTYGGPIGIPYGSSFGDATWDYPGRVRSVGLGLGWRRQLYRGLEASGRAIHFLQIYEERGRAAQTGYQLFLQARVGWRWTVGGLWLEPAVAFNWWPIERGRPASFRAKDDRWPSYFLFEPWLNLGFGW